MDEDPGGLQLWSREELDTTEHTLTRPDQTRPDQGKLWCCQLGVLNAFQLRIFSIYGGLIGCNL